MFEYCIPRAFLDDNNMNVRTTDPLDLQMKTLNLLLASPLKKQKNIVFQNTYRAYGYSEQAPKTKIINSIKT